MSVLTSEPQNRTRARRDIELSQAGDPDALGQMAILRMDPWYTASRTALFLQPDATFVRTVVDEAVGCSPLRG